MSEENVEVVRSLVEAFRRRDTEVASALLSVDVEWDARDIGGLDLAGVYRGAEGTRQFWGAWLSAWQNLTFEYDLRDGGDAVVVLIRNQRQQGRQSGVETAVPPYAWLYTVRDGRVVHARFYSDQRSALEAAGLRE